MIPSLRANRKGAHLRRDKYRSILQCYLPPELLLPEEPLLDPPGEEELPLLGDDELLEPLLG